MIRYHLYVKRKIICPTEAHERDELVAVGEPFDKPSQALAYAAIRKYLLEDIDIRPFEVT